mmetsp:Transcript_6618/g.18526  ORF Transcript_6618/g.18526 Transcript_6618/m.18526 type:complete len:228 (-) Transcript_6618:24-707(-)
MAPDFASVVTTSEVFESYEDDYHSLQRKVREHVATASSRQETKSERVRAVREASEAHQQASQALQQMELEAKSMGSLSTSIAPKLKDYRNELTISKRQVRDVEASLQREGLGADASDADAKVLGDTYSRLRSSTRRLDDAKRSALEAEEIGLDVMSDLQSQREGIMRTKGHLQEVEGNTDIARRVLQGLDHRLRTNQALVGCFAFVLFLTVVFVIYLKVNKLVTALR